MNINKVLGKTLGKLGYKIIPYESREDDALEEEFEKMYEECKEFSMCSRERMYAVYKAVKYIVENNIQGDFVECGVWMGGNIMLIAKTLQKLKATDRKIYAYDTYDGMSEPTKEDVDLRGRDAKEQMNKFEKYAGDELNIWSVAELDKVRKNVWSTNYPKENILFIKGKVEDMIPRIIPEKISLLRLDTDWYESTKHELEWLYPLIEDRGVLLIDDYGYWRGARKAVDEFLKNQKFVLLNRTDFTGRCMIKLK